VAAAIIAGVLLALGITTVALLVGRIRAYRRRRRERRERKAELNAAARDG
jgi:hypothetical protein